MATPETVLQQQSKRRPTLDLRRFEQNDYERFDEEAAWRSGVCVGSRSINRVEIGGRILGAKESLRSASALDPVVASLKVGGHLHDRCCYLHAA